MAGCVIETLCEKWTGRRVVRLRTRLSYREERQKWDEAIGLGPNTFALLHERKSYSADSDQRRERHVHNVIVIKCA